MSATTTSIEMVSVRRLIYSCVASQRGLAYQELLDTIRAMGCAATERDVADALVQMVDRRALTVQMDGTLAANERRKKHGNH